MAEGSSLPTSGERHAIEYMLKQLYVLTLRQLPSPQIFIADSAKLAPAAFAKVEGLSETDRAEAEAMVRRVMQATSHHLEAIECGKAIELR
ncbi:hypothetical protein [Asticcacaulis sp. AND118]|uniref:hypothetical protein n=1 Tax=Asticcacaulis sp. AND118 TaxID=2840468 RepID=UPI001CFFAE84|nr:hypothetical protein [Asticcacaulis sp. AND118]UDF04049.1 hypothetical protein LH365_03105 [Asticcacaulis sp. AND118]